MTINDIPDRLAAIYLSLEEIAAGGKPGNEISTVAKEVRKLVDIVTELAALISE